MRVRKINETAGRSLGPSDMDVRARGWGLLRDSDREPQLMKCIAICVGITSLRKRI